MNSTLAQQFERNVAPVWIDAIIAKTERDVETVYYSKPPSDLVAESMYDKTWKAPNVEAKVWHSFHTTA